MKLLLRGVVAVTHSVFASLNFNDGGFFGYLFGILNVALAFYWGLRFYSELHRDD